jgi:HEAT repeat protein
MASVFNFLDRLGPAGVVIQAIAITILAIAALLAFILARRAWRSRLYRRRDARVVEIRAQWGAIVDGRARPEEWRRDPISVEIVETILLDSLDEAEGADAERLSRALRRSGLLDARIHEATARRGWRRRQALTVLGRMRASDAIPAIADALNDKSQATVITAIRALGRIGGPGAAAPLLEHLVTTPEPLPTFHVENAIIGACRPQPEVITPYLDRATPEVKRMLVRALSEIAHGGMTDVLLRLTSDPEAEVRASSARLLPLAPVEIALPALEGLATDEEWFVRLRAIVALGELQHPGATTSLVKGLCDRHRFVRLRAARGLAIMGKQLTRVLDEVEATKDRYALQALLSELELSGVVLRYVNQLTIGGPGQAHAERLVRRIVDLGARRLIVSALVEHEDPALREAIAGILTTCQPAPLVPLVERALAQTSSASSRPLLERVHAALVDSLRAAQDEAAKPLKAAS